MWRSGTSFLMEAMSLVRSFSVAVCWDEFGVVDIGPFPQFFVIDPVILTGWSPAPSDRKSTRLNSSHVSSSYAVFCLKNKNSSSTSTRLRGQNHPKNDGQERQQHL